MNKGILKFKNTSWLQWLKTVLLCLIKQTNLNFRPEGEGRLGRGPLLTF